MASQIAMCSVVTEAVLDEFWILKYSFDLFHPGRYHWMVRCDRASAPALARDASLSCRIFTDRQAARPHEESDAFRRILVEKMNVLEDAWNTGEWRGVAYVDADVIVAAPLMPRLWAVNGDIALTPNYYPPVRQHLAAEHGEFNGGFVFTRTPAFHAWWREAFLTQPTLWTDQACLNAAPAEFAVEPLGEDANVGFWRSAAPPVYADIPSACTFLHVHLYQGLNTQRHWLDKSFALHCLKFLLGGARPEHVRLAREIVRRDPHGWFGASLRACGVAPDVYDADDEVPARAAGGN